MSDNHSHADFQGGRSHSRDRRHHGNISPELHQDQAPTKHEIREGIPVRRNSETPREIDPDRMRASREYKLALESIPVEQLYGHQLEEMGVCGNCRGPLKHGMDGHYHSINRDGCLVICCPCVVELRGQECSGTWTKMKHLREKIHNITEGLEDKRHYWICTVCQHKWRNKNPKARPCSECGSKKVKGISLKERVS